MVDSQNRWLLYSWYLNLDLYKIGDFNGMKKKTLSIFSNQPLKQGFGDKTLKFFLSSPINQSWQDWDRQQTLIRHDQGLLLGFGTLDSYQNHKTIFYYKYSFLCLVLKSLILMQFEYKRKYKIECELMYYSHYWFNI